MRDFYDAGIRLWYDIGHAQIRENLGFINAWRWLERLTPYLAGIHIHDVVPPGMDHLMPPRGKLPFSSPVLSGLAKSDMIRVLEPAPDTETGHILRAIEYLQEVWPGLRLKDERNKPINEQTN